MNPYKLFTKFREEVIKMTKQKMLDNLKNYERDTHMGSSVRYATNIKLHHHKATDEMWTIATDENLSEELWFRLREFVIKPTEEETGLKFYTCGRSDGWLFIDNQEVVDESNTYAEVKEAYKNVNVLVQLVSDMFAELRYMAEHNKIVNEEYMTKHTRMVLVEA